MSRRLLLDTTVHIAVERSKLDIDRVLQDDDDVSIAAITASELLVGVELADEHHRGARKAYIDELLATVPVEPFGLGTAREHARLLAFVTRAGTPRGAHDLIIAATAVETGRTVLTGDSAAAWSALPGVEAISAQA
jgi:tRNA(fMet)-specific endonuclease VapC